MANDELDSHKLIYVFSLVGRFIVVWSRATSFFFSSSQISVIFYSIAWISVVAQFVLCGIVFYAGITFFGLKCGYGYWICHQHIKIQQFLCYVNLCSLNFCSNKHWHLAMCSSADLFTHAHFCVCVYDEGNLEFISFPNFTFFSQFENRDIDAFFYAGVFFHRF